jgi:hypothetical protein
MTPIQELPQVSIEHDDLICIRAAAAFGIQQPSIAKLRGVAVRGWLRSSSAAAIGNFTPMKTTQWLSQYRTAESYLDDQGTIS